MSKHKADQTPDDSDAPESANPFSSANAGDMESLTPAELTALTEQAAKAAEHWERLVRLSADFENFKKRAARERDEAVRIGAERVLLRLLPVTDNFDMAMVAVNSPQGTSVESLKAGVNMIQAQLRSVLSESGVEEVDAQGKPFDPTVHEAVSEQESADVPEGHVLQQLRKGYRLKDRLLRPATVVVAKKPGTGTV